MCPRSVAEGSLGAYAPREDMDGLSPRAYFFSPRAKRGVSPLGPRPERSDEGRRPERSEGCLAIARQDKKGRSAGQSRGDFF